MSILLIFKRETYASPVDAPHSHYSSSGCNPLPSWLRHSKTCRWCAGVSPVRCPSPVSSSLVFFFSGVEGSTGTSDLDIDLWCFKSPPYHADISHHHGSYEYVLLVADIGYITMIAKNVLLVADISKITMVATNNYVLQTSATSPW